MRKPISKNIHGVMDYTYRLIVPLLPEIMPFNRVGGAKTFCRLSGAAVLGSALVTRARCGVFPLLPFKKHLILGGTISLVALAAPWIFNFYKDAKARNTLIGVGIAGLAVTLLTDPSTADDPENPYLFI